MAIEIVGTAYVRIRAVTTGLAADIKDGFDKGVADAKLDKSGAGAAEPFTEGFSGGLTKELPDILGEGFTDGTKDAERDIKKAGGQASTAYSKGVEDENKRHNPFTSFLDSLRGLGRDTDREANLQGQQAADSYGEGVEEGTRRRNPFSALIDAMRNIGRDTDQEMNLAGQSSARSFGDGVEHETRRRNPFSAIADTLKGFDLGPIGWLSFFGPATLAPIVGTVIALLAQVTAALGFLSTAVLGAGGLMAGLAAVALPGLGALFAAFKTETEELEEFKEAAKELLAPWKNFGKATQRFLLPPLKLALENLQDLIPLFEAFGEEIGGVFGKWGLFISSVITKQKNIEALSTILDNSVQFWDLIGEAIARLVDAMIPFFAAVAPLAVQFAESLRDMAERFQNFINLKSESGELAATFQEWYDRLKTVFTIIGNVAEVLGRILIIAGDTAVPFFDRIAEVTQKWEDFVSSPEGKNRIKEFFENAQPVVDEIFELIGNIFDLIVQPTVEEGGETMFSRLTTALDALNDVLEKPMVKKLVPYLLGAFVGLQLLSTLSGPIRVVGTAIENLGKAFHILAVGLDIALTPLDLMLKFLTGTAVGTAVAVLLALAAAVVLVYLAFTNWDKIEPILGDAADWFSKLSTPVQVLVGYLGALLLVLNPVAWAIAVAGFLKNFEDIKDGLEPVVDAIRSAWEWFTNLSTPLQIVVGILVRLGIAVTGPLGQAAAIIGGIVAVLMNFESISGWVSDAWDALEAFFTDLPDLIEGLPEVLGGVVDEIEEFFGGIPDILDEAFEDMRDGILTFFENLPGWIITALGEAGEFGENLLGWIADGLEVALPAVAEWFAELPFEILDAIGTAAATLLRVGGFILDKIIQGLVFALPRLLLFFFSLPFRLANFGRERLEDILGFGIDILNAIGDGIEEAWPRVRDWFADLPNKILSAIGTALEWLVTVAGDTLQGFLNGLGTAWDEKIVPFFEGLPERIGGFFTTAKDWLLTTGGDLIDGVIQGFEDAIPEIVEWFTALPAAIAREIGERFEEAIELGGKFLDWVIDGLEEAIPDMVSWFIGLPDKIQEEVGERLQSAIDLGKQFLGWVIDGLEEAIPDIARWFRDLPGKIQEEIGERLQSAIDLGEAFIGWVIDGLDEAFMDVVTWFIDLPGNISDELEDTDWVGLGKQVLGWVLNGLKVAFFAVVNWFVEDFPNNIITVLKTYATVFMVIGGIILGFIVLGMIASAILLGPLIIFTILKSIIEALPELATWFITDFPGLMVDWILLGLPGLVGFGPALIIAIIKEIVDHTDELATWFTETLPGLIVDWIVLGLPGLVGFGPALILALINEIVSHKDQIGTWFTQTLPGLIKGWIIAGLPGLVGFGPALILALINEIIAHKEQIAEWFRGLPALIGGWIISGLSALTGIGWNIITTILSSLNRFAQQLWDWFSALPGKALLFALKGIAAFASIGVMIVRAIVSGIVSVGHEIANKIAQLAEDAKNKVLNTLGGLGGRTSTVFTNPPKTGKFGGKSAAGSILMQLVPQLAAGAIITRPTLAAVGEAGREVVIPLTRPDRALHLARQSGLEQFILNNTAGQGDVTVLRIDQAQFGDKVDVDMVAARILSAYKAAM